MTLKDQNDLIQFLRKQTTIDSKDLDEIAKDISVHTFSKGTILLRQGDIPDKCYFVLKGCVRQYSYDPEGNEVTNNFYTEEQAVMIFKSAKQKTNSEYSLSCIEETTLIVGELSMENKMYNKYPILNEITRTIVEINFGEMQQEYALFIASSPEERYKTLLKNRPDLLHRAPQHQLASYLGITPESFSRIKRRLSQDEAPI